MPGASTIESGWGVVRIAELLKILLALALSHGANDGQKTMGIVVMALVSGGALSAFTVPVWVIVLSDAALAALILLLFRRLP